MQTTLLHLRIESDEAAALDKLAGKTLTRQAVARMLLVAALDAVKRNQGKLNFPPELTVHDDSPFTATRFNEPKTEKRK
ncbi:MAG TPA: hypothetical protein VGO57_02400 [Verrucomicrobiae bacterium]|jgi:hypothetical protein